MAGLPESLLGKMKLYRQVSLEQQDGRIDYEYYQMSIRELFLYGGMGIGIVALISYVFYRSYIAFIFASPIAVLFVIQKRGELRDRRYLALSIQFRELMNSIIAGLQAGYSIENAFAHAYGDLILLFGRGSYIAKETGFLIKGIKNNSNVEDLLMDFGLRSHIDDIRDFAEIFKIAKRSGGDLPRMIQQTADVISDKMEVRRRIATIIAAKKMEQNVMNLVPFGIILYIDWSSPGFFDVLYHNITGVAVMTLLLGVYLFAYVMVEKITDIKV